MQGPGHDPHTPGSGAAPRGRATPAGRDDLLEMGRVVKTWGLRGHVKLASYAESPDIFQRVRELYLWKGGRPLSLTVEEARPHQGQVLLKFRGRDRVEDVEDLRGETICMHKQDLDPLQPGEYYWFQLIGMEVKTDAGEDMGTLREILTTGGHDVYVVRRGGREWLVPATREVVVAVDPATNRMTVRPLEGMMDEHDL